MRNRCPADTQSMRFAPRRFARLACCLLVVMCTSAPTAAQAALRPVPPPPDPPKRGKIVDVTWTCSYDASTGTLTKRASDPGPGNVVDARMSTQLYLVQPPDASSYYVTATNEACIGSNDLASQIPVDQIKTVVLDLDYPAVVAASSADRMPDGPLRRIVVNAPAFPPRVALSVSGPSGRVNHMKSIIGHADGLDLDGDGVLDVEVNSPTWLVDIDAKQSYGYVDLREVPVPAVSTMRAEIGTRNPAATHVRGFVGPVTFFGPRGTVNMFVDLGDAPDRITLGAGHDYVTAGGGSDLIRTGDGDDVIWGGGGLHDLIYSGAGNDYVSGDDGRGAGRDTIHLGSGNDTGFGAGGSGNRVYGGPGNDFISTGGKYGLIDLGSGNDFLFSMERGTRLVCGLGIDSGPGCERALWRPMTPQPYIIASSHIREYWCGGPRTDANHCRTVDLYD